MCLAIKLGEEPHITTKEITVFKVVKRGKDKKNWTPILYDMHNFPFNEVITALNNNNGVNHLIPKAGTIYEGFHAFRKIISICYTGRLCLCIIPKGSEICMGNCGDIATTKIVVFSNIIQYFLWKIKKP